MSAISARRLSVGMKQELQLGMPLLGVIRGHWMFANNFKNSMDALKISQDYQFPHTSVSSKYCGCWRMFLKSNLNMKVENSDLAPLIVGLPTI